jgi:hypothetical protein
MTVGDKWKNPIGVLLFGSVVAQLNIERNELVMKINNV